MGEPVTAWELRARDLALDGGAKLDPVDEEAAAIERLRLEVTEPAPLPVFSDQMLRLMKLRASQQRPALSLDDGDELWMAMGADDDHADG
jgi:hypothetical protein